MAQVLEGQRPKGVGIGQVAKTRDVVWPDAGLPEDLRLSLIDPRSNPLVRGPLPEVAIDENDPFLILFTQRHDRSAQRGDDLASEQHLPPVLGSTGEILSGRDMSK